MITVYGISDDLIEIEGEIHEEFTANDGDNLLAFSDGTILKIVYDGCWRINQYCKGLAQYTKILEATNINNDQYSDIIKLDEYKEWFTWVGLINNLVEKSSCEKLQEKIGTAKEKWPNLTDEERKYFTRHRLIEFISKPRDGGISFPLGEQSSETNLIILKLLDTLNKERGVK